MNWVIISDIHLHEWNYGATPSWTHGNQRLQDQAACLEQVLLYCEQWDVKTIFMCGDLFHTNNRMTAHALGVASNFYKDAAAKGIVIHSIPGNHDIADGINSLSWITFPHKVYSSTTNVEIDGRKVCFVPWAESSFGASDVLGTDIVVMHCGVQGADIGNGYVLEDGGAHDPHEGNNKETLTIAGHYHEAQIINNTLIPGSLNQHNWGDIGRKRGFWHLKDEEPKFIETKAPMFYKIDMCAASDIDVLGVDDMVKDIPNHSGHYLKLINWMGDTQTIKDMFTRATLFRSIEVSSPQIALKLTGFNSNSSSDDSHVKKFIKAQPMNHSGMGMNLYEGTYETPRD